MRWCVRSTSTGPPWPRSCTAYRTRALRSGARRWRSSVWVSPPAAGCAPKLGRARSRSRRRDHPAIAMFTAFPRSLEDPAAPSQPETLRFRDPAWDEPGGQLPDWWRGNDDPLVYVTFGSVAGGFEMAMELFGGAIQAIAGLPIRVLLTVGREVHPDAFSEVPPHV